jgi:O-antigen ligase
MPILPLLDRIAGLALLALPVALLFTRAGADILVVATDCLFVVHLAWARSDAASWRSPAFVWPRAWWMWTILASVVVLAFGIGPRAAHGALQAVLSLRFLLLLAAMGWLLRTASARRGMALMTAAAAAWIALECWQQYLLGTDLWGWPRWGDGALTGPFREPKAGPVLVLLLFPAMLPAVMALLSRPSVAARIAALLLAAFGVATMILIGQRMPALLTVLGLLCCGVFLRRFRPVLLATLALGALLLAALPLISPPTFAKLVVHFTAQMSDFGRSPYGQLYTRAVVMTLAHPWTGLGFDGFRAGCDLPQYRHGLPFLAHSGIPATDPAACSIHPHNHYLEAATAGGLPGLLLFCAAVLAWLATLARGLLTSPDARRVGLFTATFLAFWPFASTSALLTLPNAGWVFLLLGWGLAEARYAGA